MRILELTKSEQSLVLEVLLTKAIALRHRIRERDRYISDYNPLDIAELDTCTELIKKLTTQFPNM